MPDYRSLTDTYIPTGLSVPTNVFKRADNATKAKIRRDAIRQLALVMTPDVVRNMKATVQKNPGLSPGAIENVASAMQGVRYYKQNIMSLTNESIGQDNAIADIENSDVGSQALEGNYGVTPDDPAPQVPETGPPAAEDPVPDPDDDQEGALAWLGQHLPSATEVAMSTLFGPTMLGLAGWKASTQALEDWQNSEEYQRTPWGKTSRFVGDTLGKSTAIGKDSAAANFLTEKIGSPSPDKPDPSMIDYLGPAAPRMLFGTAMNLMMAPVQLETATMRQWAGEDMKAREIATRFGLTTEEQYVEVFGYKGNAIWERLNGAKELVESDRDTASLFAMGVAKQPQLSSTAHVLAMPAKDDTLPTGSLDIDAAKEEWGAYQKAVNDNGGMIGNSTDLAIAIRDKNLAQTPWFGGEPNNRDGVLGREVYAGTVADVRTWDEKQKIRAAVAARNAAYEALGMELSAGDMALRDAPRPWTNGRAFAGNIDLDPQSFAYKSLSGAIDFGIALGIDPMTYVPGTAFTKTGKKLIRGVATKPFESMGWRAPFEADLFMDKAMSDAANVRKVLDTFDLSDIPKPETRWDLADDVAAQTVEWVDQGDAVLKPVTKTVGKFTRPGSEPSTTTIKGFTIRPVETREFTGATMYRRGSGWAVQLPDGQVKQFAKNADARAYIKANGGTGRGLKGHKSALFDADGNATLFDTTEQAKNAAIQSPLLSPFESATARTIHSPTHYTVSRSGKMFDVRFNKGTKKWDIISDGAKVSSHDTLKEAEAALNTRRVKQAYKLVDTKTGETIMRAVQNPDGTVQARGRLFESLDEAAYRQLEPVHVTRQRLYNSEVHRLINETKYGQDLVQLFLDEKSGARIFHRSKGKIDKETADMLAQAETWDEVVRVMEGRFGVSITDPAALKNFTGLHAKAYNAKMALADSEGMKRAIFRWGQLAHNTNVIDMDDANELTDQMLRLSWEFGADPDDAYTYIDELTKLPTAFERRQFFEDTMLPGLFDKRLKQMGIASNRRAQFLKKFRYENDKYRRRMQEFDDAVRRTVGEKAMTEVNPSAGRAAFDNPEWQPLLDEFGEEFTAHAILTRGQYLVLPSARTLRRETNLLARGFRKWQDDPTRMSEDLPDVIGRVMSTMLDDWRSVTLMNSAYILRNIAEEVFTAGMWGNTSVLTHPGHYLSLLSSVYTARAGAQKFKLFNRYARRMKKLAGMADKIMYEPEAYKGTKLVKAQALLDLVDITLSNDDMMKGAWGKPQRAASVGKDIAKHGVIEPVEVVYDPATGRYGIDQGKKRVLLAFQHDAEIPVRIRPGALPDREQIISASAELPETAPALVTSAGTKFTRLKDGTWAKVGGKRYQNVAFVADSETSDIRVAMLSGKFQVDDEGRILGLRLSGNPDKAKFQELLHAENPLPRDEAWKRAGGTVDEVWYRPRKNPAKGNVPVEWNGDGNGLIGSPIAKTRAATSAVLSETYGPGALMFHTSPKRNRDLILRTGLRPSQKRGVSMSELPYEIDAKTDVWIVDTRGMKLSALGDDIGTHTADKPVPKARIRLATDEEKAKLLAASGTGRNPLQPERLVKDSSDELVKGIADVDEQIDAARVGVGEFADAVARMDEPAATGKVMPAGWQTGDVTHEMLFGQDNVTGDIHDVMAKAKAAVDDYLGFRKAMRFINPYYRHSAARILGEGYADDLTKHAVFSDNNGMTPEGLQTVMMHGQNIADDQPGLKWMPGMKQVVFDEEPDAYTKILAENIQKQLSLEEVRNFLGGKQTVDEMVDAILNGDPKRVRSIYTMLDLAKVNAQRGKKVTPGFADDITINDVVRMQELDETVVRDKLRNLIVLANQEATDVMGKGTSRKVSDAIAAFIRDGEYEGLPIGPKNKAFMRLLRSELDNNLAFRESLPMQLDGLGQEYRPIGLNRMANSFFEWAGDRRDLLTQHPLMREEYVNEVERMMKWVSEKDKRKIVKDLIEWNDEPLARRLSMVKSAGDEGLLTRYQVELLASKRARKVAKEKFYDAAERRNWAVALRWAGPFLQVAANSTWRWGKAMTTRTPDVYRTIRSINTIKEADLDPIYKLAGLDPVASQALGHQGMFYRDGYGEERFLLPGVGIFASFLPFLPALAATANTSSIDLFQDGLLGGAGPILQFVASMIFPDAQARDDIIGDAFRLTQKYPLPHGNPLEKAGQSFIPTKWRNLLMDSNREADIGQAVLASRMQHGDFGLPENMDVQDYNKAMATVKRDTAWIIGLEVLGNVLYPTLGSWQYEPIGHMKVDGINESQGMTSGEVLTTMLAKEYRKSVGDSQGEERRNRIALFYDVFGRFAALNTLGKREINRGVESVGPSTEFAYEHRDLYDDWDAAMTYLLPEGDYETQWNAKEQFLRRRNENKGWTERRTLDEQLQYARQYMLDEAYMAERKRLEESGGDGADVSRLLDKYRGMGYETDWNQWSQEQLDRIERMVTKDQRVLDTVPAAKYAKKYFWLRNQVQQRLEDEFGSRSLESDQALDYDPGLTSLFMAGESLAAKDEGFARFWSLAQREYGDNMDAIRERSAG